MFAVIHLPAFALQAVLRHEPELWLKPVALVDPAMTTPRVVALTDRARSAGVAEGLTPTQALARARDLTVRPRSPAQESAITKAVLQCAYGFSPYIESTAPGTSTLDLRGLAELKNADAPALAAWAERLRKALCALNLHPRIGVGSTPNLARHAARWTDAIEIVGNPTAFIAALPVAALDLSSDVAGILQKWGIGTVGELLALGQAELVDRIGLETLALFAAASTTAMRPLHLVQPDETFEELFEFEDGLELLEPLLFVLRRFVDQISLRLELGGKVCELLILRLRLENGESIERRLRVPQPTRNPDILFRMLHTHLDSLRTDSAIISVGLTANPCAPEHKQFGLFEAVLRDPHQFQETLARLTALLGADRVGTPVRENSHRPDAFKLIPPDFENAPDATSNRRATILQPIALRRLRPAINAQVETVSEAELSEAGASAPVSISCSVTSGKLKLALGPWRASGNWWEPGSWQRDEWDVTTRGGQTLRLARTTEGWLVEGVVD
jgi:protein ImuB